MVGSKWSLVDYKRRVSPNVTIQAHYGGAPVPAGFKDSKFVGTGPTVGLAVGGKMYGALDLTLSIVYFDPITFRAQKIYRDKDSPRVWYSSHFNVRIS
jgi:hypothetical protein